MKVLYVAGREAEYSRTRIVRKALEKQGIEVIGCFPPDKSFRHYPKLVLKAAREAKTCDLVLVGFYGQILLPMIRLLTRKPILFDMYIATYHTMVEDREKAKEGSFKAWLYKLSDVIACRTADRIVLESQDHIDECVRLFRAPSAKFRRIFLAVDNEAIYPRPIEKKGDQFLVHFHGEFAPFHGVRTILEAARLLQSENIRFQIIGRGITYERDRRYAEELGLTNVTFIDPVPYESLADYMAQADLCLGIFGENPRTLRVVTNKVIEAIAMAKPLITSRNAPVQELLTHLESVFLIDRANPQALADAVRRLRDDESLRARLAEGGYRVFQKHCTLEVLGRQFKTIIEEMVKNGN